MTAPKKRNASPEFDIQASFYSLIKYYTEKYPFLALLHSTPNEAKRTFFTANRLKLSGMVKGVPDITFPVPNGKYGSLFIEFKAKGGVVSPAQKEFMSLLRLANNKAVVCWSAEEALKVVADYMQYEMPFFDISKGIPM